MDGLFLPHDIINVILNLANEAEQHLTHGPRTILEAAENIALKSSFRTSFIHSVHKAAKIRDHWMVLKCWLMIKRNTKEHSLFDFEIEIHDNNADKTIHLDSVTVNRNPMPNGGYISAFFIGDAFIFLIGGSIGVIYKQQIYRICAIYVPGYKKNKDSMSFGAPQNDDVLKMQGHWFGEYKGDLPSLG